MTLTKMIFDGKEISLLTETANPNTTSVFFLLSRDNLLTVRFEVVRGKGNEHSLLCINNFMVEGRTHLALQRLLGGQLDIVSEIFKQHGSSQLHRFIQ